jgi:hypothetical protein
MTDAAFCQRVIPALADGPMSPRPESIELLMLLEEHENPAELMVLR